MLPADQIARQDQRHSGAAVSPQAKVPTYQELLDAALDDTFPASDPLAVSTALHVHEPRTTARDCHDWSLQPGACPPTGQPAAQAQARDVSQPCEARLRAEFTLHGVTLPAGVCWVQQSLQTATLVWHDGAGRLQSLGIDLETLRRLLANGLLERPDEA